MHTNRTVALKPNFMSSLLLRAVYLLVCIFLNISYSKNLHNIGPKLFAFHIFGLKCFVFIPICLVKALQDDISVKTIPILLHHTLGEISPYDGVFISKCLFFLS